MGFEQLEKDVLAKAEKNAEKILEEAKQEAAAIKDEVKKEAKAVEKDSEEEVKFIIDIMKKREIASSRLDTKKSLLMIKKELIGKVFDKAKSALDKKLKKPDRKKLIEELVKKAQEEIDVGVIYCNKVDMAFVDGAEEKDMVGGIIAESKDKTTMVDYSFETMIEDIKEKHISKITNILFGKHG